MTAKKGKFHQEGWKRREKGRKRGEDSLVPRPYAFVACSTKFAQRAWAHHVRSGTTYVTAISLRINDVIEWASTAFYVERGSQRSQWWFVCKLS